MKRAENKISDFLKSRSGMMLMTFIGLAGALLAYDPEAPTPFLGASGFVWTSADSWLPTAAARFGAGIGLTVVIGALMELINRTFNLLRTSSLLFIGIFVVMQAATPPVMSQLTSSLLLNLTVLYVAATFYSVYMRPRQTRRIFLAFCIMSAGSMADYRFALYALVFMLSFQQMRCPSPRMYLAALMGIITPWWIALGFGLTADAGIHWPVTKSIFEVLDKTQLILMLVTVGVTVILGFLICSSNMVKIYSYNAKNRALSGLLAMLSLFTATATLADIANAPGYLSTLNCLTAFQAGLFFRIVENRRGYIYILSLTAIYIAIYFCNLWL